MADWQIVNCWPDVFRLPYASPSALAGITCLYLFVGPETLLDKQGDPVATRSFLDGPPRVLATRAAFWWTAGLTVCIYVSYTLHINFSLPPFLNVSETTWENS